MEKQYRVPFSVTAMRYAMGLSPKGCASWSEKSVARKIVLGIMSLSVLIVVNGCSRGDDTYRAASGRVAESTQEEDVEVAAQLMSALMWRAQQEQAQRDRYNQMQAEENRQGWWREWEQRQARERQIRQEEYIRQDARERYQRADQADRAFMKVYGY